MITDYGTCPRCGKPYNAAKINATVWFKPEYNTMAGVTLFHTKNRHKHAIRTRVHYRYDPDEMVNQAVSKLKNCRRKK